MNVGLNLSEKTKTCLICKDYIFEMLHIVHNCTFIFSGLPKSLVLKNNTTIFACICVNLRLIKMSRRCTQMNVDVANMYY